VPVAVVVSVDLESGFLHVLVAGAQRLAVSGDGGAVGFPPRHASRYSTPLDGADESDPRQSPVGIVAAAAAAAAAAPDRFMPR